MYIFDITEMRSYGTLHKALWFHNRIVLSGNIIIVCSYLKYALEIPTNSIGEHKVNELGAFNMK